MTLTPDLRALIVRQFGAALAAKWHRDRSADPPEGTQKETPRHVKRREPGRLGQADTGPEVTQSGAAQRCIVTHSEIIVTNSSNS